MNPKAEAPKLQSRFRFFQGLPVREGRGNILVQPTKEDISQAKRHDPENCAYAVCIKRMLQTSKVYVYTTICYIETLDETGKPMLERYVVKDHAHAYIQAFDNGEKVAPGGFILHKPNKSRTLEYKRKQSRSFARDNPERIKTYYKQALERTKKKRQGKWKAPELRHQMTGTFRDGTGMVKFLGTHDGKLDVQRT